MWQVKVKVKSKVKAIFFTLSAAESEREIAVEPILSSARNRGIKSYRTNTKYRSGSISYVFLAYFLTILNLNTCVDHLCTFASVFQ